MFTPNQLRILAKILYIALGYESRSTRIRALLSHRDMEISLIANQLKFMGYLKPDGVDKAPQ